MVGQTVATDLTKSKSKLETPFRKLPAELLTAITDLLDVDDLLRLTRTCRDFRKHLLPELGKQRYDDVKLLFSACFAGLTDIVRALLENGADPNLGFATACHSYWGSQSPRRRQKYPNFDDGRIIRWDCNCSRPQARKEESERKGRPRTSDIQSSKAGIQDCSGPFGMVAQVVSEGNAKEHLARQQVVYFPIHVAAYQNHKDIVSLLIDHSPNGACKNAISRGLHTRLKVGQGSEKHRRYWAHVPYALDLVDGASDE